MEQLGATINPSEPNEDEQRVFEQQLKRVTERHARCLTP
jgi:hypothetical protein